MASSAETDQEWTVKPEAAEVQRQDTERRDAGKERAESCRWVLRGRTSRRAAKNGSAALGVFLVCQ
jgi:hypothetical protein